MRRVPELSLMSYIEGSRESRQAFTHELFSGLKDYGFIILKDHPIRKNLLENAYTHLEELFNLPETIKTNYALQDQGFQRGYTPFGKEHAKDSEVMDLKEFWHIGQELSQAHPLHSRYPANIWPKELANFKNVFLEMYTALEQTGKTLLEALAPALQVADNYFDHMVTDGNSILRLLHYPPIPEDADPRCLRAAAHEDINLITILVSASSSGLQLKDRDGTWLDVESDPGSLIVDAGDMLSRITNEKIPATTHRVINPTDARESRYSMPFFMHPHPDALLTCLPSCVGEGRLYPDIRAEDFLMQRLEEIGLINKL